MKRDFYEVLGVSRTASAAEIKSSYRKLAIKYHPDRNADDPEAEARFKEAAEAYAVLSDDQKRARYDRFGHQGVAGAGGGGFSGGFDPSVFGDFSDILGDLFGFGGGRRRRGGGVPGADLRYRLQLDFEEAVFGADKELTYRRLEACAQCAGTGSADGELESCSTCGGVGQVRYTQGFLSVQRPCPECRGEGRRVTNPCAECSGAGRVEVERTLEVSVPAGVEDGMRLRLRGEGEHGLRGGPTGDLEVQLSVRPHERLQRQGSEIHEIVELTYPQLVLGTELDIETVHGAEPLRVPTATQPGAELRLRGKGARRLDRDEMGDHVVHVALRVPKPRELDSEQVELLERLAELEGRKVGDGGVMGRVKSLFH
ncbi:MAG: molecular chaperone DnaJ [Acidobacteriota bacterium]